MKSFVVLSALLAVAAAMPGYYSGFGLQAAAPIHYAAAAPAVHYAAAAPAVHYAAAPVHHHYAAAAPLHYPAAVAGPLHYHDHAHVGQVQYTAGPAQYAHVPAHYPAPQPDISSRYHAQTEIGEASHGYAHPGQAASEVRDASGAVSGQYSYVNPDGKEVRVTYKADSVNGFQATSNLAAEVIQDTPEVAEARAAHLKAVADATASAKAALDKALKDAAEKEAAKAKSA